MNKLLNWYIALGHETSYMMDTGRGMVPRPQIRFRKMARFTSQIVPTVVSSEEKTVCLLLPMDVEELGVMLKAHGEKLAALFGISFKRLSFDRFDMRITDAQGEAHEFDVTPLYCISWSGIERLQGRLISGEEMGGMWMKELDDLKVALASFHPERYVDMRKKQKVLEATEGKMQAWRNWLNEKGIPLLPPEGFVMPVSEAEMELKHKEIFGQ